MAEGAVRTQAPSLGDAARAVMRFLERRGGCDLGDLRTEFVDRRGYSVLDFERGLRQLEAANAVALRPVAVRVVPTSPVR